MLYKEAVRRLYVQILIIIGICAYANAESLYVVRHGADTTNNLLVFEIVDNELVFQAQQTITTAGYGGIDLAIDNENNVVFVSNESSSVLTLVNAKTLDEITTVTLSGPTDLTGIVYDPTQQKLYGTERNTNELYSYSWNAQTNAMTPDPCNPFELDGGIDYACGLSLNGSILYVSDYYYLIGQQNAPRSSLVYKYDVTDEFSYQGTIDMDDGIVSIVHDSYENAMYAGAYGGTNDTYIIKHDLDLGSPIQKDIGTNAIGIETNDNTGLLYVTTYRYDPCSFSSGGVEVYDTSSWTSDPNQVVTYEDIYNSTNDDDVTISNLAGLVIGGPYKPEIMGVTITPDPCTCIYPADQGDPCYIEYTICYSGGGQGDQTNTWLTAHLPNELYPTDPCDEHFFLTEYAFIWNLTTVAEDANNCVSFEAYVLPGAEPLGSFTLEVELESDTSYTTETITTNICCWGGDTIYVNQNVSDEELHTGISWQNAYANLQDAINRADQGCGNEIWVAKGTYIPTEEFAIPTGVAVYGGFQGNETSLSQRDPHRNLTILSGNDTCSTVVSATDSSTTTTIDGFAITQATSQAIDCDNADLNILNCVIANNIGDGIYIDDGAPYISHCNIYDNAANGINTTDAAPEIKNTLIHNNTETGIVLDTPSGTAVIHNNTICNNNIGISRSTGTAPDIRNCIIYGNTTDQATGTTPEYSCIQDPNNAPSCTPDAYHNITADPCFAYDPNLAYNFHLSPFSCCVDKGDNTHIEPSETDIDGDTRIIDGDYDYTDTVDMGADEVACSEVSHEMDITGDGVINNNEFYLLADAWLSDPCDDPADANTPNWNPKCDFYCDNSIDMIDLGMLVDAWLWQACYYNNSYLPMMMRTASNPGDHLIASSTESILAFSSLSTASLLTAQPITTDTSNDLTEAQLDRIWQQLRPPYTPSIGRQIIQLEENIYWLENLWLQQDGIQDEISKEEFYEFLYNLQDELEIMEAQYWQNQ